MPSKLLNIPGCLDSFPCGAQLDQNAVTTDAFLLVQFDEFLRLSEASIVVERQASVHFRRHTTWNELQNLNAEVDELQQRETTRPSGRDALECDYTSGLQNDRVAYQLVWGRSDLLVQITTMRNDVTIPSWDTVVGAYSEFDLPYFTASFTRCWYCGFWLAASTSEGLVVASVGLYCAITARIRRCNIWVERAAQFSWNGHPLHETLTYSRSLQCQRQRQCTASAAPTKSSWWGKKRPSMRICIPEATVSTWEIICQIYIGMRSNVPLLAVQTRLGAAEGGSVTINNWVRVKSHVPSEPLSLLCSLKLENGDG